MIKELPYSIMTAPLFAFLTDFLALFRSTDIIFLGLFGQPAKTNNGLIILEKCFKINE